MKEYDLYVLPARCFAASSVTGSFGGTRRSSGGLSAGVSLVGAGLAALASEFGLTAGLRRRAVAR